MPGERLFFFDARPALSSPFVSSSPPFPPAFPLVKRFFPLKGALLDACVRLAYCRIATGIAHHLLACPQSLGATSQLTMVAGGERPLRYLWVRIRRILVGATSSPSAATGWTQAAQSMQAACGSPYDDALCGCD